MSERYPWIKACADCTLPDGRVGFVYYRSGDDVAVWVGFKRYYDIWLEKECNLSEIVYTRCGLLKQYIKPKQERVRLKKPRAKLKPRRRKLNV